MFWRRLLLYMVVTFGIGELWIIHILIYSICIPVWPHVCWILSLVYPILYIYNTIKYYDILYRYINSNSTYLFVRISAEYSLNATRQGWVLPCHPSIVDCPQVRWSIISWGKQRPDALQGRCKNFLAGEPIRWPGRPWVSFSDLSCWNWGAPFSADGDVIWWSATWCWTGGVQLWYTALPHWGFFTPWQQSYGIPGLAWWI